MIGVLRPPAARGASWALRGRPRLPAALFGPARRRRGFARARQPHATAIARSRRRLKAAHTRSHSPRTFATPRSMKRRKAIAHLISACGRSACVLRRPYRTRAHGSRTRRCCRCAGRPVRRPCLRPAGTAKPFLVPPRGFLPFPLPQLPPHPPPRPQPPSPALQLRGEPATAVVVLSVLGVLRGVHLLHPRHDRRALPLQPRLLGHHPPVAHRLVARRVGPDLGAVDRHQPQLPQPRRPC